MSYFPFKYTIRMLVPSAFKDKQTQNSQSEKSKIFVSKIQLIIVVAAMLIVFAIDMFYPFHYAIRLLLTAIFLTALFYIKSKGIK